MQMDLGSSPSEIIERAMDSRELKHVLRTHKCKDLVLKVVGREEYMLKEKRISCYKVWSLYSTTVPKQHKGVPHPVHTQTLPNYDNDLHNWELGMMHWRSS